MRKIKAVLIIVLVSVLISGCGALPERTKGQLCITTTVFPVYDFARAVSGGLADISLLIRPGVEIHSYDPTPSDIVRVLNSELFIRIGGESEEWTEKVLSAGNVKTDVLTMMEHVPLLYEDDEPEYDEHIWTSPENAVIMVNVIRDKMSALDPGNAAAYERNAASYVAKIRTVQAELKKTVTKSNNKFILVADRFPFRYLIHELSIDYEAAFGGCATSADVSLKVMEGLVKTVKQRKLKAAYYTEMSGRVIADTLAEETGVALYELNSAHNVTKDSFESGITYAEIMENNLRVLRKGLLDELD